MDLCHRVIILLILCLHFIGTTSFSHQLIVPNQKNFLRRHCNNFERSTRPNRDNKVHHKIQSSQSGENDVSIKIDDRCIIKLEIKPSISSIPEDAWNRCLAQDGSSSPFMEHSWLRCLEDSGCATRKTGWVPQHIEITIDSSIVAYIPLYIKAHSKGEFIFDNEFANYAQQNNIKYYPKLLVGIPFTPVTGSKILMTPELRERISTEEETAKFHALIADVLKNIATSNDLSSLHMNFLTGKEAFNIAGLLQQPKSVTEEEKESVLKSNVSKFSGKNNNDFIRRTSLQYHWLNRNVNNDNLAYQSFEDYLECFKSKKRMAIRRERNKATNDQSIRVDAVVGKDIVSCPGLVERMFEIYKSTVDKKWSGRQYLTLEFFQILTKSNFLENLVFLCARDNSSGDKLLAEDVFAGTINIVKDGVFYGRYWGCIRDVKYLHFHVCYWCAIDYCIKKGLQRMEPGAGGEDYKWKRGFDPALIHSIHYFSNGELHKAVSQYIEYDSERNIELCKYLTKKSAVKGGMVVDESD